ncbi:MAG: hypothetical protein QOH10_1528, partial [Actinomycetota bacterium]|nr:hypothetical protein [Actinomycetota bacterium]
MDATLPRRRSRADRAHPGRLEIDLRALADPEHFEGAAETEVHREAQGEVEDLVVGEPRAQPREQVVVDPVMIGDESLGVLDGQSLTLGVTRIGAVLVQVLVDV